MNNVKELCIRPHHGLCIQHYVGYGYDSEFVKNMDKVIQILSSGENIKITLQIDTDILCGSCPDNLEGVCKDDAKVRKYDESCLSICGFHEGQQLEWSVFVSTITEKLIKNSEWKHICNDCRWVSLCEKISMKNAM